MVPVTVCSSVKVLSLILSTRPVMVASCGSVTVLLVNSGWGEEVPKPTQPSSLMD